MTKSGQFSILLSLLSITLKLVYGNGKIHERLYQMTHVGIMGIPLPYFITSFGSILATLIYIHIFEQNTKVSPDTSDDRGTSSSNNTTRNGECIIKNENASNESTEKIYLKEEEEKEEVIPQPLEKKVTSTDMYHIVASVATDKSIQTSDTNNANSTSNLEVPSTTTTEKTEQVSPKRTASIKVGMIPKSSTKQTKIVSNTPTPTPTVPTSSTSKKSRPPIRQSLKPYIEIMIQGDRHLTSIETENAFSSLLTGAFDPIEASSMLALLRMRGETPEEVAGMVHAMNKACNQVHIPNKKLLDIVGTGGDGADTINISTASAVLAAACGCTVAKAGNRSVSSACGSADVLERLGVKVDLQPNQVVECVNKCDIAFMFAPVNHPAMKHIAPIRKDLGVRTCFNILGPMINAASAQRAVIGVFHEELVSLMAGALKMVKRVDHAVVIHGVGLDEISPMGPATILEIKNVSPPGEPKVYKEQKIIFDPLEVGIPRCKVEDLKGGGPEENAQEFRKVLQGGEHTNAKRDSIILNAGVGCYVYGLADSISGGCDLARKTLESGKAHERLESWIQASQSLS